LLRRYQRESGLPMLERWNSNWTMSLSVFNGGRRKPVSSCSSASAKDIRMFILDRADWRQLQSPRIPS
jgi:hypothetical protein